MNQNVIRLSLLLPLFLLPGRSMAVLLSNEVFEGVSFASSSSANVRLDMRTSFGGRLATGVEKRGVLDGSEVIEWVTTEEENGWKQLSSDSATEVAVLNDPAVTIEEGRLEADTVWTADTVHLVRNWVSVPKGITLRLEQGTVVKFTENTGFWVEDGGTLDLSAASLLTQAEDDTAVGDTDMRDSLCADQGARIHVPPEGIFVDLGMAAMRYVHVDGYGIFTLQPARCLEQEGAIDVFITASGERDKSFSCTYETVDGTALAGEDYQPVSGTLFWTSTEEGAKAIRIPIIRDHQDEPVETFKLRITSVSGMNIEQNEITLEIVDSRVYFASNNIASATASPVRLDMRTSTGGRLAHGVEKRGMPDGSSVITWDTATEQDGWIPVTSGGETAELLVRNSPSIEVEEGRLAADTVWNNTQTHLVRNWVVVPNGKTLTLEAGCVVKFTENTGIIVEDGGQLVANGTENNRIVFSTIEDDSIGGDDDIRTVTPEQNGADVLIRPSGTFIENGMLETRFMNMNSFGSVSIQDATLLEQTRCAIIPVTLDTERTTTFAVDWVAKDGTATFGEDYTLASGTLRWNSAEDGTGFISIPINEDTLNEGSETFTVELVAGCGVNLARTTATVTITDSKISVQGSGFASAASAPVRLEQRATLGGQLVYGTEQVGTPNGDQVSLWDTTAEPDGLFTLETGNDSTNVVVLNRQEFVIEEGRLTADTTWANEQTHVARNWIVIPNGITLTVNPGTVVKFTEDTGIFIEDGGTLNILDGGDEITVFMQAEDDSIGGDVDGIPTVPGQQVVAIEMQSAGIFQENGTLELRHMQADGYGTVSIQDARAVEVAGITHIPVTIDTDRDKPFSITWEAIDGTATLGNDYSLASGTLTWTSADEGTKSISIPLIMDAVYEPEESFTVRITATRGVNLARAEAQVLIVDSSLSIRADGIAMATAAPVRFDQRESFGGRLSHGDEQVGSGDGNTVTLWQTAELENGWHTLTDGDNSLQVATVNGQDIVLEEGRLTADTQWDDSKLHLVRNWIVIPDGITLTVNPDTVVKFTEDTGIKIEDGGTLNVPGDNDARAIFTVADDDTVGGDTDFTPGEASSQNVQIYKMKSGTIAENGGLESRKIKVNAFNKVSVHPAQTIENEGVAYIPISVTGERNKPFAVDWEIVPGSATLQDDYLESSGTVLWNSTDDGIGFIKLPLVKDDILEPIENFTVKLRGACGMNIETESAEVTLVDNSVFQSAPVTLAADPVRVDTRTSFGGRLAHGDEKVGSTDGSQTTPWATASEPDGIKTLTDGEESREITVQNSVVLEEGRLLSDTIWGADQVHLVRNWVVIPKGVTLSITEGTIVKFTEDTGIIVEPGGKLNATGSKDARIIFTMAEDDCDGGDTDFRDLVAERQNVKIDVMPNGTFTENGWLETRLMNANTYGKIAVNPAQAVESVGAIRVPITITGERNRPFSIFWRAIDGTATFGDDYTLASGRIDCPDTEIGVKEITIPLVADTDYEPTEHFKVELTGACGMNIDTSMAELTVLDSEEFHRTTVAVNCAIDARTNFVSRLVKGKVNVAYSPDWEETPAASVHVTAQRRDGTGGLIELASAQNAGVSEWDTSALSDGWYTLTHQALDASGAVITNVIAELNLQQKVIGYDEREMEQDITLQDGYTHYLAEGFFVGNGKTLTIEPGAIVKMEYRNINVTEQGSLQAMGTREKPIIITSLYDDRFGGDLDGSDRQAAPGDWTRLYLSGQATMDYVQLCYGGATLSNAVIHVASGETTFDHGTIQGTRWGAFSNDGGILKVRNSLVKDGWRGVYHWNGSTYILNSIFDGVETLVKGRYLSFINSIFRNIQQYSDPDSYSLNFYSCCFWNPAEEGYPQSAFWVGSQNNIWTEPVFADPAGGDYHLPWNSPLVDKGKNDSNLALTDPDGIPYVQGPLPDIGLYEAPYTPDQSLLCGEVAKAYPEILDTYDGDPLAASLSDTDGDGMALWEEYIVGTSPTDPADRLRVSIELDSEGKPVLSWEPILEDRIYTILGKETLLDAEWKNVDPNNLWPYHFFCIRVSMPD